MLRCCRVSVLAVVLAVVNVPTASAADASNVCLGAKMRATAKNFTCRLRERAKELRGHTVDVARCDEKLNEQFAAADGRGGCAVTGDAGVALAQAAQAEAEVFDAMAIASADESEMRCALGKTKAVSRYAACQAAALAKRLYGSYRGLQPDFVICLETLEEAFIELESDGPCPVTGESSLVASAAGRGYGYIPSFDWGSFIFSFYHQDYAKQVVLPNARMTNNDMQYIVAFGADFSGADLTGSNLVGIEADGADFTAANLSDVDMTGAYLRYSSFGEANLSGTDLTRAYLNDATLGGAHLATANLTSVRATNITGCPASLPGDWRCGGGCLAGPTAGLEFGNIGAADFSGIDLSGAVLYFARFDGTNLAGAMLAGVDARFSSFYGASLAGADMSGINLKSATMSGTDLSGATMSGALLESLNATTLGGCPATLPVDWTCVGSALVGPKAFLLGAVLSNVDLSGLNLADIRFPLADLSGSNLAGTSLLRAELTDANLAGANLAGVDLRWADLEGADLSGVDLSTADLRMVHATSLVACPAALPPGWFCLNQNLVGPDADLKSADLAGLDLSNLDLTGAYLGYSDCTGTLFGGATLLDVTWFYTTCPDGNRDSGSCCGHMIDVPAICTE